MRLLWGRTVLALAAVWAAVSSPAAADTHLVASGETLATIAARYACSTDALLRANRLTTTTVPAGTIVTIPLCGSRARMLASAGPPRVTRTPLRSQPSVDRTRRGGPELDRARRALAMIDGDRDTSGRSIVERAGMLPSAGRSTGERSGDQAGERAGRQAGERSGDQAGERTGSGRSTGELTEPLPAPTPPTGSSIRIDPAVEDGEHGGTPWRGRLPHGTPLPPGEGYFIRRPRAAFGAAHVVAHLRRVIAEVRALHPSVHVLSIGDLSAERGGPLERHASHQSGLDVDVGFYFTSPPRDYPEAFAEAGSTLDLEATWALVTAFARTAIAPTGVHMIFLDYGVQARLHRWARARGTPDDELAELLQYPRGKDALVGIVRHWPSHEDHMHVRFKAGP